jgi:hypothetical protein
MVHEMFGDAIISAIDFKMDLQKVDDPEGGQRAVMTLDGKFLKAFGGALVAPLSHQDVEFGFMLVYRTPQQFSGELRR